jgi:uncharacterized protein (DUF58 family)
MVLSVKSFFEGTFLRLFEKFGHRHNKIFIIPTRHGLYFIAIVFILFLISLSYGHSLAFTTTFVFVALVMTSAHFTNYNLAGVDVVAIYPPEETFAGEEARFKVTLRNNTKKHRFDLFLKVGQLGESEPFSLRPGQTSTYYLSLKGLERGEYQLKRLTVATSFPFGLFYAWKFWYEEQAFFVFPRLPEESLALPRALANNKERGEHEGNPDIGAEEFFGHQNYDIGMPLRAIDWKAYARGKGLLLKKFIEQSNINYILRRDDYLTQNGSPVASETVLEVLTGLVLDVHSTGASYALVINDEKPQFGQGRGFRQENLKRLAKFGSNRQVLQ